MKVLLDEMLPAAVAGLLLDHAVVTVKEEPQAAWIRAAVAGARSGTVTQVEPG